MTDILKRLPLWFLLVALFVVAPVAGYTIRDHIITDKAQSNDLVELKSLVREMVVVIEHNYKEGELQHALAREERGELRENLDEARLKIERILAKIG